MVKALLLSAAALSLCISSPRCMAAEVVPVIYLSTNEAAKAKQTAQMLKSRWITTAGIAAGRGFNQDFQAAHTRNAGAALLAWIPGAPLRKRTSLIPFPSRGGGGGGGAEA